MTHDPHTDDDSLDPIEWMLLAVLATVAGVVVLVVYWAAEFVVRAWFS